MDKSQKQLIDTYFRKRRIAVEAEYGHELNDYELVYSIKNNLPVDKKYHTNEYSFNLILNHPELIDRFNLTDYGEDEILMLLHHYPSLINYFSSRRFSNGLTRYLIADHPELVSSLNITNLDGGSISKSLIENPELINYFNDKILSKMDMIEIGNILRLRKELSPQLKKYSITETIIDYPEYIDKYDLSILDQNNINKIINAHPELAPYFKEK